MRKFSALPEKEKHYVRQKIAEFKSYFEKEIAILNHEGVTYHISYEFLGTLIRRLELFIGQNTPFVPTGDVAKGISKEDLKIFKLQREKYLSRVTDIIEGKASCYSPTDGSFWESVKEDLETMAGRVKAGKVKRKK